MAATLGLQPQAQQRPAMKADTLSRILGDMCRPGEMRFMLRVVQRRPQPLHYSRRASPFAPPRRPVF